MTTNSRVDTWLQRSDNPLPPDKVPHPADVFPAPTFSNPPSSSSDGEFEDFLALSERTVAGLVHPPTPTMESHTSNHTRRRSRSLVIAGGSNGDPNGHKRVASRGQTSGRIPETLEDESSDDEGFEESDKSGSSDFEMDDMISDDGLEDDEETGLTGKERRKRRRRKRRNTRLDERIAGGIDISKEEEKIANASFWRATLTNALLIGLWYFFSISISIYNKWMFGHDKDQDGDGDNGGGGGSGGEGKALNFPYPLFTTCMHMIVQFSLASLVLLFIPSFRPRQDSISAHHGLGHADILREPIDPKKPLMTRWFYFTRIGPCGAATGMDIGLGNMSLRFISLTFFTMCKSSVLGFVLLFAFLFRLETPSWKLFGIIATMTVGVVMMVAGETAFDALGFILIMTSALSSGFRWSLTQILLLRNPATSNPFSSIFFLAPVMFLSLLVIALPVEGPSNLRHGLSILLETKGTFFGIVILLFPGTLAFLMTASEFALLKRTSVVTLSICGIFKEVVTISAASIVFDDKLTPINVSGLFITISSIAAYNYMKIKKMREEARMEAHLGNEEYAPVLSTEPADDVDIRRDRVGSHTEGFIRSSLSIATVGSLRDGSIITESPTTVRTSPIKRPEDID